MNEEELENRCLDWFRKGGWDVLYGPDIAPDLPDGKAGGTDLQRDDYAQVMLKHDLEVAFTRINRHLPHECFDQVVSSSRRQKAWIWLPTTGPFIACC